MIGKQKEWRMYLSGLANSHLFARAKCMCLRLSTGRTFCGIKMAVISLYIDIAFFGIMKFALNGLLSL